MASPEFGSPNPFSPDSPQWASYRSLQDKMLIQQKAPVMTPRTEPMPEPVPEWLKEAVLAEAKKTCPTTDPVADHLWWKGSWPYIVARILWERGEPEPVDPDVEAVKRIIEAWYEDCIQWDRKHYAEMLANALAAYKAEKDRA